MNKQDEQKIKSNINSIFSNLDNYLKACRLNEEYPRNDILTAHVTALKSKIFGFVCALDCIDSLEHNTNLNDDILKKETVAYQANNHSFAKNLMNMEQIINQQNLQINAISDNLDCLVNIINYIKEPIKIAYNMKDSSDKSGENNANFKGLTDAKLTELVSKGYSISDIIRYTQDPNNKCQPYTHPAIKKRLKQLGLVAVDGRRGEKHAQ